MWLQEPACTNTLGDDSRQDRTWTLVPAHTLNLNAPSYPFSILPLKVFTRQPSSIWIDEVLDINRNLPLKILGGNRICLTRIDDIRDGH